MPAASLPTFKVALPPVKITGVDTPPNKNETEPVASVFPVSAVITIFF